MIRSRRQRRRRDAENSAAAGSLRRTSRKAGKSFGFVSLIFSLALVLLFSFTAFAADNHFYIEELNLNIDLPDEMTAITRESPETNRYFSLFGLDYETTMSNFENNNIYLQGMYEDSSRVFTVTAASDENSKSIGNYSALSDDQLIEVEESFLKEAEYSSCTIQRQGNYIFMDLQFQTEVDGQTVYARQCNTIVDGNSIILTLLPSKDSELTTADYKVMNDIMGSIVFAGQNTETPLNIVEKPAFWYCVIIAVVLIAVIIVVIFAVKKRKNGKKSRQTEKKRQNEELLQELAREFSQGGSTAEGVSSQAQDIKQAVVLSEGNAAGDETAESIIEQFRSSEDYERIRAKKSAGEAQNEAYPKPPENLQEENPEAEETEAPESLSLKRKAPELKIVTPDGGEFFDDVPDGGEYETGEDYGVPDGEYDKADGGEYDEEDEDYGYGDDGYYDHSDDYYGNRVIASEKSFRQSEDYFDEAPEDGAYSRSESDEQEEYGRKAQKREKPEKNKGNAGENIKTAGAVVLNGILIFLNGVKSFFIHIGYFVTNLTRLIKRKHKINKRKKAEAQSRREQEDALRRRRENQLRKQQKQSVKDASGLVKVHSQASGGNGSGRNRQ